MALAVEEGMIGNRVISDGIGALDAELRNFQARDRPSPSVQEDRQYNGSTYYYYLSSEPPERPSRR